MLFDGLTLLPLKIEVDKEIHGKKWIDKDG